VTVFVDTSYLYALLDQSDIKHTQASLLLHQLETDHSVLVTHNYVLIETSALIQNRLGIAALRSLYEDFIPILQVEWITQEQHGMAVEMALTAARKKLSVVDCASFIVMRQAGISSAFAFDHHFREQGFRIPT
jgi:predicted nucleic acid-binding protein